MTRSVAVTGGASGIGLAIAKLILERWEDSTVGLIDRDERLLGEAAAQLGPRATIHACDVADQDGAAAAVSAASGSHQLVGLVNAAGTHASGASIDMPPEDWHAVLGVHLDGSFYCAQAAARLMAGTGGSIVNFSSVAKDFGWPGRLPYSVAKAGVCAMTRTLAVEWATDNIRVNAVAPGYVNTPMITSAIERGVIDAEERIRNHALGRFAEPVEIAEAVEFLLSDRSSFITGEVIRVDGGFSILK